MTRWGLHLSGSLGSPHFADRMAAGGGGGTGSPSPSPLAWNERIPYMKKEKVGYVQRNFAAVVDHLTRGGRMDDAIASIDIGQLNILLGDTAKGKPFKHAVLAGIAEEFMRLAPRQRDALRQPLLEGSIRMSDVDREGFREILNNPAKALNHHTNISAKSLFATKPELGDYFYKLNNALVEADGRPFMVDAAVNEHFLDTNALSNIKSLERSFSGGDTDFLLQQVQLTRKMPEGERALRLIRDEIKNKRVQGLFTLMIDNPTLTIGQLDRYTRMGFLEKKPSLPRHSAWRKTTGRTVKGTAKLTGLGALAAGTTAVAFGDFDYTYEGPTLNDLGAGRPTLDDLPGEGDEVVLSREEYEALLQQQAAQQAFNQIEDIPGLAEDTLTNFEQTAFQNLNGIGQINHTDPFRS